MKYFSKDLFLYCKSAKKIYEQIKDLPIVDYHCHLDQKKIKNNDGFGDIGELWLAGDHYKWRAMRLCGIDEYYITGGASFKEKFLKFASILPKMAGNAVYYWSAMELSQIFGVNEPLNAESAERIYDQVNEKLKDIKVRDLLKKFKVEYIATTDDPIDSLADHGDFDGITVRPTFRPDKIYAFSDDYISALGKVAEMEISSLDDLKTSLAKRLDYFVEKGCRISDHGFMAFPKAYATETEANEYFKNRSELTLEQKDKLFGHILLWLTKQYAKRNMIMQLHFSVIRNNNPQMFAQVGVDAGFDLLAQEQSVTDMINYFAQTPDDERPETVIYTLNDNNLSALVAVTGAFRKVKAGAAWWFNDTVEGIRKNLKVVGEYSALGTNYGMLTDSRSFSSYVRFDFFRRLLAQHLGDLVEKGEYELGGAIQIAKDICYNNIRSAING